jgi:hypothetical protein
MLTGRLLSADDDLIISQLGLLRALLDQPGDGNVVRQVIDYVAGILPRGSSLPPILASRVFSTLRVLWNIHVPSPIWGLIRLHQLKWVFTDSRFGETAGHLAGLVLEMIKSGHDDPDSGMIEELPVDALFQIIADEPPETQTHQEVTSLLETIGKRKRLSWLLEHMDLLDRSLPMLIDIETHPFGTKAALQHILWSAFLEESSVNQMAFLRNPTICSALFVIEPASDLALRIIQVLGEILRSYPPAMWDQTFTEKSREKMTRFIQWLVASSRTATSDAVKWLTECFDHEASLQADILSGYLKGEGEEEENDAVLDNCEGVEDEVEWTEADEEATHEDDWPEGDEEPEHDEGEGEGNEESD